jgi:hypothetical protein
MPDPTEYLRELTEAVKKRNSTVERDYAFAVGKKSKSKT